MASTADGVDLEASVGYALKEAAVALRTAMEAVLAPLGLTVTQYSCLELLSQRPGTSGSELARGAFVTRQSMHVLLQGLERDGLVEREVRPVAGRVLPARLTPAGAERLREASAAVRAVESRMTAALDRRQLAAVLAALRGFTTAVGTDATVAAD